jgi:hypothetical protein
MNKRIIKVYPEKDRELYDKLMSATLNHTEYDGCSVMHYAEHLGENLQMIGEFTLRDKEDWWHLWRGSLFQLVPKDNLLAHGMSLLS